MKRLHIINGPRPMLPGEWFRITAARAKDEPSEVMIYGQIGKSWSGDEGISAADFAKEWDALPKNQPIALRIHSQGGSVFEALAIYNTIGRRKADVTAHIDGVALSAASFIAMAAGKVVMPKTARMMIHDAQGIAMGDSEELRELADLLDRESDRIADIYAGKTGKTRDEIRDLMRATTWMDGDEAKSLGFCDEVNDHAAQNCDFDLSAFLRVPDALKNDKNKSAVNNGGANQTGETVNKTAILALLMSLGVNLANTATDDQILAELAKLVGAGKVSNEERDRLIKPPTNANPPAPAPVPTPTPAPAPAPQNVVSVERFNQLQNQLNREREMRITALFDQIVAENPSIDRAVWLPRVLQDETLIENLAGLPGRIIDPSRPSVSNLGNPLVENYRKLKPGAERQAFRLENQGDLQRFASAAAGPENFGRAQAIFGPQNANTLAAALTPDYLADGLIVIASAKLAPLALFSTDFGVDRMKPRATVQVAKATVGSTGQTNPTNFESGDSTLAAVEVTVNQIVQSFHISNNDMQKGHKLANLAGINADTFANALSDVWTALLLAATYGTPGAGTGIIGASTAFAPDDLPALFGLAKNFRQRNLILDGSYIGYLFPGVIASFSAGTGLGQRSPNTVFQGVFGFDNIAMQNRWTGAIANAVGFLCGPDAIAVASGLPLEQPANEFISRTVVDITNEGSNQTGLGISVEVSLWYSRATRTIWASYDVMFGAAAGDASTTLTLGQGRLLVSA